MSGSSAFRTQRSSLPALAGRCGRGRGHGHYGPHRHQARAACKPRREEAGQDARSPREQLARRGVADKTAQRRASSSFGTPSPEHRAACAQSAPRRTRVLLAPCIPRARVASREQLRLRVAATLASFRAPSSNHPSSCRLIPRSHARPSLSRSNPRAHPTPGPTPRSMHLSTVRGPSRTQASPGPRQESRYAHQSIDASGLFGLVASAARPPAPLPCGYEPSPEPAGEAFVPSCGVHCAKPHLKERKCARAPLHDGLMGWSGRVQILIALERICNAVSVRYVLLSHPGSDHSPYVSCCWLPSQVTAICCTSRHVLEPTS
ncbi:hypothetical protein L226DRAFT_399799 [Lentinus tigrinus ALCF2SS1-7]|uniref:uncharacterized protein n=1 Tax=Lentinus tigrinus ALCF2SS1-7 TaxID=1328758 RepID=UPI001166192A|nr:hypothetical protein L226DRAFT_399799 [Lentinus tigrinus ALCF2SS1-7]